MLIGYARVSTAEQNLDLQLDALQASGCEDIFTDKLSGTKAQRPGLEGLKKILRKGDTLVIWRLDRLARSMKDLIEWSDYLKEKGVALKSLQESIDTTTSTGKLIFHFFGALAEFERNLIQERTQAGLTAARARGRVGGRPEKLSSSKKEMAINLYSSRKHTVKEICDMVGITKPTLYRYLDADQEVKKEKAV